MERLVTPGPLSSDHAKLESSCNSCHSSFRKEAQNSKCAACHKGIKADIASRTRFHGKFSPARTGTCKSCHSEHRGRSFKLVAFDRATFNHSLTNYPLTGAHTKASCTSCHGAGSNYRGTSTSCSTCHKADEPHQGKLGTNCQACHTTGSWKEISRYDHAKTGFALSGAHARASCMSCHTGQTWKGLPRTCISCHSRDDAHKGSRGTNCGSCHSNTTWRAVTFDHNSTGFPLIGGHAAASCAGCHGPSNAVKKPGRTCIACHAKDDAHERKNGTECAECHTSRSWTQIQFDHNRLTEFALKGAHLRTSCESCHKVPAKTASPPMTCFGCHSADDSHKGGNGQDCGRCHTETSWKKVNFDHNKMTGFALTGKHAQAKCEACHVEPADVVKLSVQCGACHAKDDAHSGKLGKDCARCHDTSSWADNIRFDHALTRFPLLGKHRDTQCIDCHVDQSFAAKGVTCASCHKDDHHRGSLGAPANCQACHNALDWKNWSFDHDSRTDFALTGKHRGLICSACHNRPGDPGDTRAECVSCHRRQDVHRGGFGTDCERCHNTESFAEISMRNRQ